MLWFKYIPLLRVLLAYMAGIWSALAFEFPVWLFLFLGFAYTVFFFRFLHNPVRRWGWISGWMLAVFFFAFGNQYALVCQAKPVDAAGTIVTEGYAIDFPGETAKNVKAEWMAETMQTASGPMTRQLGLVYFPKQWKDSLVQTGIRYKATFKILPFPKPNHLNGFDYGTYLLRNGFSFVAQMVSIESIPISKSVGTLKVTMARWRQAVIQRFEHAGVAADQMGLITAFFLGDKSLLDADLKDAFLKSGTIHLLAVSGMHVAILYVLAHFFLGFMSNGKWCVIRYLILMAFLWSYGLLTGMSPSVFRAVWMMSLIETARTFGRETSMMNTLAVALLLILLFDPHSLYAAGLWLSFGAVAGIFWFYKPLAALYAPRFPVWKAIWQMTAVTIAAQLGTLPLTLYYFHTFPTYFLFNNLILVPLSMPVLLLCTGVLALPVHTLCSRMVVGVLNDVLQWIDSFVRYAETLPYAVWKYIPFDGVDFILWFAVVLLVAYALYDPSRRVGRLMWILLFALGIKGWVGVASSQARRELVVVNTFKGAAVQLVDAGKSLVWVTDSLTASGVEKGLSGYWAQWGVGKPAIEMLSDPIIFSYRNCRFGLFRSSRSLEWMHKGEMPSVCVICGNFIPETDSLSPKLKKVILAPVVGNQFAAQWEKLGDRFQIEVVRVVDNDYVHKIK